MLKLHSTSRSQDLAIYPLPVPLTSFIGRQPEMAQVKHLLASSRLVTLTGAGGCGKTRLALHVASDLRQNYPDGVCWVDLAPLADATLLLQAIAQAGASQAPTPGCDIGFPPRQTPLTGARQLRTPRVRVRGICA